MVSLAIAAGEMPAPPEVLGGDSLTALLESGKIEVKVDPKYPQAIGIVGVLDTTKTFGNCAWEILRNKFDNSPFFTSDFPVAIERSDDVRVLNRLVPLTPTLALRICPNVNIRREKCDFSFSQFSSRVRMATRKEVAYLNTAFVRCAETMVFYRDDVEWVQRFVERNRHYRIEPRSQEIPHGTGTMIIATQRVVANA